MDRILIIEDEEKIARFIELELTHEGYEVVKCADGRTGLEMAESGGFSLVLLDIMLPELNGMEVLRRLRRTSDVPVIMLTARDAVMDKVAGLDQGGFLYLAHPDLINYVDDTDPFYLSEMRRLCVRAKELNVPLEINLLGILDGRHYPHDTFWAIASEIGNEVVFGSDAHYAQNIAVPWVLDKEQALVDRHGLKRLMTLPL